MMEQLPLEQQRLLPHGQRFSSLVLLLAATLALDRILRLPVSLVCIL
jgi:hypothetical protein